MLRRFTATRQRPKQIGKADWAATPCSETLGREHLVVKQGRIGLAQFTDRS
jgi:hypothetical protein